jgi:chromosome segregation protein
MKLKQIKVSGFKSFADKTIFDFDVPLTAVVGPNGCGKSNIVDAFRFCLGEHSAKSIRGDKMLDVIFSGSEKRKPLSLAEVTLVFCNEKGILPIDYSEVSVTRRIFRSGESQYLINKNEVRLKDIESLFWNTGLGKDAFSIFEQGKIDEIIYQTPHERRYIFEEAAGVLRFKQRRKEMLKRMESVDANLLRAQDIHQLCVKHKETLEKQAHVAKIFEEKRNRLIALEKHHLFLKWSEVNNLNIEGKEKIKILEDSKEDLLKKMQGALEVLEAQKNTYKSQEEQYLLQKEALSAKKNLKVLKNQEMKSQLLQKEDLALREKNYEQKYSELKEKKNLNLKKFIDEKKENFVSSEEFEKVEVLFKESKEILWDKKKKQADLKNEMRYLQDLRLNLVKEESSFKSFIQELTFKIKALKEKNEFLTTDKVNILEQIKEINEVEKQKKEAFDQLSLKVSLFQEQIHLLDKEIMAIQKEIFLMQEEEREFQKKINELNTKLKFLNNLKTDFEGISKASKRLLQESKIKTSPLFGKLKPLYEQIKPKKGLEELFIFSMRFYEDTLVVKDDEDLELVKNFVSKEKLKGFSLLALNEKEPKDIFYSHFSASFTKIKDNIIQDSYGVLFYVDQSEKNPFLREVELKNIQESLDKDIPLLKQKQLAIQEKLRLFEDKKAEKMQNDKSLRQLEMRLVEVNFGLQSAINDGKKAADTIKKIEHDLLDNTHKLSTFEITLKDKQKELETYFTKIHEKAHQFDVIEKDIKGLESIILEKEEKAKEVETHYKKLQESLFRAKQLEEIFNASNKELEFLVSQLKEEKESILEKKTLTETSIKNLDEEIKSIESFLEKMEMDAKEKKAKLEQFFNTIKIKENEHLKIDYSLKESQDRLHQLELNLKESEILLKTYKQTADSEYKKDIQDLILDEPLTLSAVQNHINQLKAETLEFSNVNMGAIEEFQRQKEQEEILNSQLQDLRNSKDELYDILKKLDDESRKIFSETFSKIRQNFKKNFEILFQGGSADLIFIEGEDLLDAGIEIQAKPPGKQMRSISLLSGGEKCLTSLSLLFALFEVRPAAFCILDEVDAPLDEVNVEKFVRIIKQFALNTQFIVVTHNKRTMKAADKLIGISMEEKGVSKPLTLAFEREEILC